MYSKRNIKLHPKNVGGGFTNFNQATYPQTFCQVTNTKEKIVGKIKYFPSNILGKGEDTRVYHGIYDGRPVAVKRISYEESDQQKALNEIDMLLKCDQHENVVKYYAKEVVDNDYVYIALELCQFNLEDWVLKPTSSAQRFPKPAILEQVTRGLQYLHELDIIHRDLKPQNILLSTLNHKNIRVKISDFGISKSLPVGRTSKTLHTGSGTIGWMAPEIIQFNLKSTGVAKMTRQTDIFSLGCVFYFVLSNGQHPFGENNIEIPNNVLNNEQFIFLSDIQEEYWGSVRLMQQMISEDPKHRPQASVVLSHHLFWSKKTALQFCVDISNLIYNNAVLPRSVDHCLQNMEKHYSINPDSKWVLKTTPAVKKYIRNNGYTSYDAYSTTDLIRLIRNMQNHYINGLHDKVKWELGTLPNEFMSYWLIRFPFIIDMMWSSFSTLRNKIEFGLREYYWQDCNFQFRRLSTQETNVFEDYVNGNY